MQHTNQLIKASSPYLLQHAHNPVNWYEWNEESLKKAKEEHKLILLSIGYSACHWCHVMERESFENEEVAEVMNKYFICIKVDREERPDVDQVYMLALQLMNGSGGWPLNMICLPDQKPIYGGTYFKPDNWISILQQLAVLWQNEPQKMIDYALQLTQGLHQSEFFDFNKDETDFNSSDLAAIVDTMKFEFDLKNGGYKRAPKFPLPNNWIFLYQFAVLTEDKAIQSAVELTLTKMADGGIYDQIGGGFARYSVDDEWHVPHFEKMIYDNAQLLSLYAEVYQKTKNVQYANVIKETISWIEDEMMSKDGLFYSALDADSEGVEGKYYVWTKQEFEEVIQDHQDLLTKYFNIKPHGNWEEEQTNVLRKLISDQQLIEEFNLSEVAFERIIAQAKKKLLSVRKQRIKPGLDDKCITAWNALMAKGLIDAAQALNEASYYGMAKKSLFFILQNLIDNDGQLFRNYKDDKVSISGFLDDYAFLIDALIAIYQYDFDEAWLNEANDLCDYVITHFTDENSPMFYYVANNVEQLVARKHEVMDNVIPSSNAVMANNLKLLGVLTDNQFYIDKSKAMLAAVLSQAKRYGSAFAKWANLLLIEVFGLSEIAIVGEHCHSLRSDFNSIYIPNKIFLGGKKESLPLLKDKVIADSTKIYVCKNNSCQLPVSTVREALPYI